MPCKNVSLSNYYSSSFEVSSGSCSDSSVSKCTQIIPRVESQNLILYEVSQSFSSIKDDSVPSMHSKSETYGTSDTSYSCCKCSCNVSNCTCTIGSSELYEFTDSFDDCICLSNSDDIYSNECSLCSSTSESFCTLFDNGIVNVNAKKFGSFQCNRTSKDVHIYEISNHKKMSVQVLTYGARVHKIFVPDKNGNVNNVILSCESLEEYLEYDELYLNATIGRMVGVVKDARFCFGGESFYLNQNLNEKHHYNGGRMGLDRTIWDAYVDSDGDVLMTCTTKDGDEGYPGTLLIQARFSLTQNNELRINYTARSTLPCPCNISNRIYLNLAGVFSFESAKNDGSDTRTIYDHFVNVNASYYTFNNQDKIVSKCLKDVSNTEYDLRISQQLGIAIARHPDKGFNCLYKLLSPLDTSKEKNRLKFVSSIIEPVSGRALEIFTTENFVWFSTCNDLYERICKPVSPDYDLNFLGLSEFPKRLTDRIEYKPKSLTDSSHASVKLLSNLALTVIDLKKSSFDTNLKSVVKSTKDHIEIITENQSELTIHDSSQTLQNFDLCLDKEMSNPGMLESSKKFLKNSAFYFQPQNFPNAVNHQNTFQDIILKPG